ncbi:hypothetical protein FDP41_005980 [Naegleria fowleri]|uniref:Histidine kinase n=1 Tax=Naegleria fowleri TaxID=5763 RepID=A0A6A5BDT2_NAEFO|nr:uncharacterized protein FDP41_005980 [Naegleria fowleri]KAF0975227.1 hypothetical protein FDP41_005980 [Naegleria fowleri]
MKRSIVAKDPQPQEFVVVLKEEEDAHEDALNHHQKHHHCHDMLERSLSNNMMSSKDSTTESPSRTTISTMTTTTTTQEVSSFTETTSEQKDFMQRNDKSLLQLTSLDSNREVDQQQQQPHDQSSATASSSTSSEHHDSSKSTTHSEWQPPHHHQETQKRQTSSSTASSSTITSHSTTYILYLYEKIHQRLFVPFLFLSVYLYLCLFATDSHFYMALICFSLMAINLPIFKDALQSTVIDKLLRRVALRNGWNIPKLTEFQTHFKDEASETFMNSPTLNSNSSNNSSHNNTPEILIQRIYTYKLVILINILLHFLRLHLANRDPTFAWMCVGFLASTIHNLSSFILHNSISVGEDGLSTALWSFLPLNVLSVGTSAILAIQYAKYSEAFGVLGMLTIFNLVFNTTSFKLMEKLNVMNIMTSRLREANKSKNALLSSISHEFRSPLMSISGCIELLLDTPLTQDQLNYLKTIGCCSSMLLTLIEDLLQYSKLEKGSLEVFASHLSATTCNGNSSSSDSSSSSSDHIESTLQSPPLQKQQDQKHNLSSSSGSSQSSLARANIRSFSSSPNLQNISSPEWTNNNSSTASNSIFSLEECLEHVKGIISTYAQNFSVSIQVVTSQSLPSLVYGESVRLQQILINLLTNAVKASPPHSTVLLKVENLNHDTDSYNPNIKHTQFLSENGSVVETIIFKVIDNGKGIPKEIQQNLFKPYFSGFLQDGMTCHNSDHTNSGMIAATSTGLGLAIARKIVATNFHGDLTFQSNSIPPNTGTTFIVTIPFRIPDKKKKNSLKYIEDLLKNQNIPTQLLSTEEHFSNHSIQKSHLLHKELFKIKPSSTLMMGTRSSTNSMPSSPTLPPFTSHHNNTTDKDNNNTTTRVHNSFLDPSIHTSTNVGETLRVEKSHPPPSNPRNELIDVSQYNILLAEDNPINLSVLKRLLEKGGFKNITTSSNGLELINAFQQKFYHLIITDYHMPLMDGLSAAHVIRGMNHGNDTKIIILTADTMLEKHEFMDSIDFSLNKPISAENLNKAVVSALLSTTVSFDNQS